MITRDDTSIVKVLICFDAETGLYDVTTNFENEGVQAVITKKLYDDYFRVEQERDMIQGELASLYVEGRE